MPVPDYQSLMLPVLKALADGRETPISEVRARVAKAERLRPDDFREMLASGQPMFANRVSWAVTYMERAGLVERVRRAIYRLTADGHTVGEGDLRSFAGAIDAAGTTKGVFVTTATFTSAAKDYVKRSPKRIVLIDGEELARLMVEYDIGVRTRICHTVKRIDEDYFEPETL